MRSPRRLSKQNRFSVDKQRSVQVLMSHLVWVLMGVRILRLAVKPFFDRKKVTLSFLSFWFGFGFGLGFF